MEEQDITRPAKATIATGSATAVKSKAKAKQPPIVLMTGNAKWDLMYHHLNEYKTKHNNCLVPNRYKELPQLGSWVSTQRRQYKLRKSGEDSPLTQERIDLLTKIGFVWATKDPRHVPWEQRYDELLHYKQTYGDCLIPVGYEGNPQLANWVSTQRQEWKAYTLNRSSRLTQERVSLLSKVGFVWEAQRGGARKRKKAKVMTDTNTTNKINSPLKEPNTTVDIKPKGKVRRKDSDALHRIESKRPWIVVFKEYLWFLDQRQNPEDIYTLKEWASEQREEYRREKLKGIDNMFRGVSSKLTYDQFSLLQSIGFDWDLSSVSHDSTNVYSLSTNTVPIDPSQLRHLSPTSSSEQMNHVLNCPSDTTESSGYEQGGNYKIHSCNSLEHRTNKGAEIEADAAEALFSLGGSKK